MIKSMSFYSYELNKEKYDKIKDYAILCLKQKNILSFYINKDLKIARKLNEEMNEIASDQSIAYADDVCDHDHVRCAEMMYKTARGSEYIGKEIVDSIIYKLMVGDIELIKD